MALTTSGQIAKYFETYGKIDVTFNKNIIDAIGLQASQIYIKITGKQIPCIIYSTSMIGAKLVANLEAEHFELIRAANNVVSLRYAFSREEKADPLSFFIGAKVIGFQPYNLLSAS